MGKVSMEVVQLRKKALSKKSYLSKLQQLSWRIKKIEELYSLDSEDLQELRLLIGEYDDIYSEFLHVASLEIGTVDYIPYGFEDEEVQNEE